MTTLDEQVAARARERQREDELLERLAAGTLTPAERAELEGRAGADPELRAAVELCQPLSSAEQRALVERLAAPGPRVVSLSARSRRRWLVGGLALAAGLAALVLPGRPGVRVDYTLEVSGDAVVRGALTPSNVKLAPTSRLTLVARPAHARPPPGAVRLFVAAAGDVARREVAAEVSSSADGAVRVELDAARLGAPGSYLVTLEGDGLHLEAQVELTP